MTLVSPFKRIALLFVLLAAALQLQAQDKMLTMQDAISNPALQPENLRQLTWVTGTDAYTYLKGQGNDQVLMRGNATSQATELITLSQLSAALEVAGGKAISSFPALYWVNADAFVTITQHKVFR